MEKGVAKENIMLLGYFQAGIFAKNKKMLHLPSHCKVFVFPGESNILLSILKSCAFSVHPSGLCLGISN